MTKGAETRERIVERAFLLAGRDGLEGVTIGALADELKLSKSGLFAHFGSKEELQVAVLDLAAARFSERVVLPAIRAARGLPRLRALFENWLNWLTDPKLPGGCIFPQAVAELDDREGRARDALVESQRTLDQALERAVQLCIDEGHLRKDTDPKQVSFELRGIILSLNQYHRLYRDRRALTRAREAFDRLVARFSP